MEILSLEIQNFLAIGPLAKVNLSNQGLVLIQGVNEDDTSANSNGVGKSSIADALCWALYGKTARGESTDDIVNNQAKKDTLVRVYLQDGATAYEILRTRKHSHFKNTTRVSVGTIGGVFRDISKGTERETQELITGIVGCSLEVFMASIYAGQEEMPDLPKMTDKNLKLLIEEAAGVERLEKAYEIARSKSVDIEREFSTTTAAIQSSESAKSGFVSQLAMAEVKFDDFEASRKVNADAYKTRALAFGNEAKGIAASIDEDAAKKLESRLQGISDELSSIKVAQDAHKDVVNSRFVAEKRLAAEQRYFSDAMKSVERFKAGYENAEHEMSKPCDECGKPHDASEVDEYKAHMKKRLTEEAEKAKALKKDVATCQAELDKRRAAEAASERELPDASALTAEHASIAAKLSEIRAAKSRVESIRRDVAHLVELAKSALTTVNPFQSAIDTLKGQIEMQEKRISELTDKRKELEDKLEVAKSVVKVFGPAGVRAHILDTVTPYLNERTDEYLSVLSDGNISAVWTTITTTAKGDLKEKFNIEVTHAKGGKSFGLLSGGEKRKVRLATMLALQDLVASRASKPISLWIGDEIDDALDSAGLERLMGILELKARERGTVLIISHNELRDWVDNVLTVTKRGGSSTIEGALCLAGSV